MGCMLRSDEMAFCFVYLQKEAAFDILAELGELGCIQFLDMTPAVTSYQRKYVSELCRCVEMERKLMYIKAEMVKDNINVPMFTGDEPFALKISSYNDFETQLEKWVQDIHDMAEYYTKLSENFRKLSELYYVLSHIGPLLGEVEFRRPSWFVKTAGDATLHTGLRLTVLTGVVKRSRSYYLELMLWRISRGNVFFRTAEADQLFEDPATNTMVRKVAFVALCQGDQVQIRVRKICAAFYADLYPCPMSFQERTDTIVKLDLRLQDLDKVMRKTKFYRCKALRSLSRNWLKLMVEVRKAKAVYITMNLFSLDYAKNCLIGECWVPEEDLDKVRKKCLECSKRLSPNVKSFISKVPTELTPPTYHRVNKFTRGFQTLISAYGDSTYRELNPGLFTLVTFPFLFAVMFGDFGHGLITLVFALWMVIKEKKFIAQRSDNEIWNIFFGGRYIILMMSLFTLFTGLIYNDIFSRPIVIFKSAWQNHYNDEIIESLAEGSYLSLDPAAIKNPPYPFGVDPIWAMSKNNILFANSLKMKMSIVLGVIHMLFGIILSFFNHQYFGHTHAIVLEFLPQVIFLCCLFLWLVILIFLKWVLYDAHSKDIKRQPGCAPLILIHFIDMCLMRTTKTLEPACDAYMFNGQKIVQMILVSVGLVCVPILLFGSPLYICWSGKRKTKVVKRTISKKDKQRAQMSRISGVGFAGSTLLPRNMSSRDLEPQSTSPPFAELMIQQGVHTIEFVLSTISHTASYLRLWALSLAHSQLSEMLWGMVLSKLSLKDHTYIGSIKLFVVFVLWQMFTLSILVVMEGLSAFLHTLRLHWVEFMSKFFIGDGKMFQPFHFKNVIHEDVKDEAEGACKQKNYNEDFFL